MRTSKAELDLMTRATRAPPTEGKSQKYPHLILDLSKQREIPQILKKMGFSLSLNNPKPHFPLLLFASLHLLFLVSAQSSPSAYDVLQQYGFPVGILPIGVTGYKLDRPTGRFTLYLNQKCKFSIESYQLEYKSTITGVVSQGRIRKLKGVSVRVLLLWLNIVEVINDGEELMFSVGLASANFPINSFYESPQCGCGFDCGNPLDLVSAS